MDPLDRPSVPLALLDADAGPPGWARALAAHPDPAVRGRLADPQPVPFPDAAGGPLARERDAERQHTAARVAMTGRAAPPAHDGLPHQGRWVRHRTDRKEDEHVTLIPESRGCVILDPPAFVQVAKHPGLRAGGVGMGELEALLACECARA
ncbi:hypothetical protein [Streptomyces sp. NBC_01264]|uniref:hypothetical protein n=1 Tax=Streptomyces sp. NBC_01264 TaxID=2903804 RepID=UPI002254810B|nr:hypothetical protein [Streptomyces sp. NBC_01264]MCX4775813.1 hypothetical protein [Streptomyces sp. NBC_01264]